MLARIRKAAENKDSGFTLIELLVVMIIIGILAAIAIPAFLSQKNKAKSTSAKSDASTIGKELAAFYVDGGGAPTISTAPGQWTVGAVTAVPASGIPGSAAFSGKLSEANKVAGKTVDSTSWCVTVWNTDVDGDGTPTAPGNATWSYNQLSGLFKGVCNGTGAQGPAL